LPEKRGDGAVIGDADDEGAELVLTLGATHMPIIETGLRGTLTDDGRFVVPFADRSNALDCLRIVLGSVLREGEEIR
jgi:hypothetical protein